MSRSVRAGAAGPPIDGWRVLPFEHADAEVLLAGGAALLDALAHDPTPALRWYRAAAPAVVLGRGQPVPPDVEMPVVTRYSGGGAVLMDESLLSLDVLVPAGHPLLAGDLGRVFLRIGHVWATALAQLGVRDVAVYSGAAAARRRGTPRERLLAAVCYATLGRGEVTAGGRKIVGLAQRRRRPGALVQCGLLRCWEPSRLLDALHARPDDPQIRAAAVGLDDLVAEPPRDEAVIAAVHAALAAFAKDAT